MDVTIYAQDGTDTGRTVSLDAAVFEVEPSDHAIWLDVRAIQAAGRQGTHKAKERAEAAGSTRKLYRQKGTGYARAGSAKSPIRKSGGTIFGPRPRSYRMRLNRKTKQTARRSALTYKAQADALRVIEDFAMEAPKTAQLVGILRALELAGQKVLVVTDGAQPNVYKSGRNVPKVQVQEAAAISTLDVLQADIVLFQESALGTVTERLRRSTAEAEEAEAAGAEPAAAE